MRKPLVDVEAAPGIGLRRVGGISFLHGLGVFDQPVGGVWTPIEEHVLDATQEVFVDVLVDGELACIHDPHIHAGLNGMVEED